MKIFPLIIVLVAIAITITSCGRDDRGDSGTENESGGSTTYTYKLTENGCETGTHNFSSKTNYCEGLRSDILNKGCAYSLRKYTYESNNCPGTFSTKP